VAISASDIALCDLSLDSFEILCFTNERFTKIEVLIVSVIEGESHRVTFTAIDTCVIE
jgi:hypothetical protein